MKWYTWLTSTRHQISHQIRSAYLIKQLVQVSNISVTYFKFLDLAVSTSKSLNQGFELSLILGLENSFKQITKLLGGLSLTVFIGVSSQLSNQENLIYS